MARKTPLTRERILRTAIDLADREGLSGLTMRRLGRRLRVEAMSLYNHVRNKEDLIDGMIDLVFGEIDLPAEGESWRQAMRRRTVSVREVLGRHRWAIGLMESRLNAGPSNLHHHDSVLRCLRQAGFSVPLAGHAYSALDSYVYGFALNQQSLPFESGPEAAAMAEGFIRGFKEGEYRYLAEIATDHVMKPGYSYEAEFEYGLDLILDGLEAALTKGKRKPGA